MASSDPGLADPQAGQRREADDVEYTIDSLYTHWVKSKIWLYSRDGRELFFDLTQKRYSPMNPANIREAMDDVITAEHVPSKR